MIPARFYLVHAMKRISLLIPARFYFVQAMKIVPRSIYEKVEDFALFTFMK